MSHAAENSSSDEVSEAEDEFEIESVEGIRTNRESQEPEFLVRWKGHWPGEAYTWIPKEAVKNCPKLVDYYIRSNPHLTHPEAKARRVSIRRWFIRCQPSPPIGCPLYASWRCLSDQHDVMVCCHPCTHHRRSS